MSSTIVLDQLHFSTRMEIKIQDVDPEITVPIFTTQILIVEDSEVTSILLLEAELKQFMDGILQRLLDIKAARKLLGRN